jgi:hypothetical protein
MFLAVGGPAQANIHGLHDQGTSPLVHGIVLEPAIRRFQELA